MLPFVRDRTRFAAAYTNSFATMRSMRTISFQTPLDLRNLSGDATSLAVRWGGRSSVTRLFGLLHTKGSESGRVFRNRARCPALMRRQACSVHQCLIPLLPGARYSAKTHRDNG